MARLAHPFSPCPLTGTPGFVVQRRSGAELLTAYERHFGLAMPLSLRRRYFEHEFTQLQSQKSGLRWFSPAVSGCSDLYEYLSQSLPWYYAADTWDKQHALNALCRLRCQSVFEIGCGSGEFLRSAAAMGMKAAGSEINEDQLSRARRSGMEVFIPTEIPSGRDVDAVVMLQVLEHIPHPLEFLQDLLQLLKPRFLLVAVPCFESLLGRTTDPLVWPPHHISFWSAKALETTADLIRGELLEVAYEPLGWPRFRAASLHGFNHPLLDMLTRRGPIAKICYAAGRSIRCDWAQRAHSIFGLLAVEK